jgi:hypothetical protein
MRPKVVRVEPWDAIREQGLKNEKVRIKMAVEEAMGSEVEVRSVIILYR